MDVVVVNYVIVHLFVRQYFVVIAHCSCEENERIIINTKDKETTKFVVFIE